MVVARSVPKGFVPEAKATLAGYLTKEAALQNVPPDRKRFAELLIDCGGVIHAVWCYDDLADWAAGVPADSAVRISGDLQRHEWRTGGRASRDRVVIRATHGEVVAEPHG